MSKQCNSCGMWGHVKHMCWNIPIPEVTRREWEDGEWQPWQHKHPEERVWMRRPGVTENSWRGHRQNYEQEWIRREREWKSRQERSKYEYDVIKETRGDHKRILDHQNEDHSPVIRGGTGEWTESNINDILNAISDFDARLSEVTRCIDGAGPGSQTRSNYDHGRTSDGGSIMSQIEKNKRATSAQSHHWSARPWHTNEQ